MGITRDELADDRLDAAAADLQHRNGDAAPMLLGLMLAEEVADAVQQLHRFFDPHTPAAALNDLGAELADVVITVSVLARLVGIDLGEQINHQLELKHQP